MLGHADIQTTMISLHERDCIVNTADTTSPTSPSPLPPVCDRRYTPEEDVEKRNRERVVHHDVMPCRHTNSFSIGIGPLT